MNLDEHEALIKKGAKQQSGEKPGWTTKDAASLWTLTQSLQTQIQMRSEAEQTKKRLRQGLRTITQHHPEVAICLNCNSKYYLGLK